MMNIFADNTLNIDEYKPDSKGVEAAKRIFKIDRICIIAMVLCEILAYYIMVSRNFFELYCVSKAIIYVGLFVLLIWAEVIILNRNITMRKVSGLSDQEKFDFNYYCLYKKKNMSIWARNNYLVALSINCALMGLKEKCKDALSLISYEYKPPILNVLNEWIESEDAVIDRAKVGPKKRVINPICFAPLFLVLDIGVLTACIDYNILLAHGATKTFIAAMGYIQSVAFVVLGGWIAVMLIVQTGKNTTFVNTFKLKATAKIIIGIVALLLSTYSVITNEALRYGLELDKDDVTDISTVEDNIDDSIDDSPEDYNDYYEDESLYEEYKADYEEAYPEEEYPEESADYELDIMNKMIILCNYLQKNGVIDDFSVELGYNAKGRVKGTVAQDDDYIYVLYDNGTKKDKHGNDCIELVLEAEPLDENGNSLGQSEASLKGFYLVDLESGEVTDEHKTHW